MCSQATWLNEGIQVSILYESHGHGKRLRKNGE